MHAGACSTANADPAQSVLDHAAPGPTMRPRVAHTMEGYTLGRLFGIGVRVTPAFLYVAGVVVVLGWLGDPSRGLHQTLVLALLLVSLLAHEFGHALVAQRLGIRVIDVTLWHLGGMARMQEIPESPRLEAAIASAGPLANLALAALAAPLLLVRDQLSPLAAGLVFEFAAMNVLLGALNLLPAFPMDGGRLLRAWLAARSNHLAATERAVRVGKWVAAGMVVAGAVWFQTLGFFLALLVAGFVWFAGAKELIQVRMRHTGSPFRGPLGGGFFGQGPGGPFGGAFAGPFAGQTGGAQPFGAGDAAAEDETSRSTNTSDTVPPPASGARRPSVAGPLFERRGPGFSEDDVRRLEAYRGRLERRGE
jgi:Zn-dependent protease